eukprot:1968660-Prymnesium_polylepis.1
MSIRDCTSSTCCLNSAASHSPHCTLHGAWACADAKCAGAPIPCGNGDALPPTPPLPSAHAVGSCCRHAARIDCR